MTEPDALADLVAREIRAEMGRQHISTAKLARLIGRGEMYVRRRVDPVPNTERVILRLDDVEAIAVALNVPVALLLGQTAPVPA